MATSDFVRAWLQPCRKCLRFNPASAADGPLFGLLGGPPRLLRVGLFLRFFSGALPPVLTPVIPNEREESASALSLIAASSYPACEEREEPRGVSRHLAFFLPSRLPRLVLLLPGAVNGLPELS